MRRWLLIGDEPSVEGSGWQESLITSPPRAAGLASVWWPFR